VASGGRTPLTMDLFRFLFRASRRMLLSLFVASVLAGA
jgi:hypothetical protein